MRHLNIVIGYCIIGCVINILLDIILIPEMSYVGVSVAYVSTEFIVAIIAMIVSRKFVRIRFFTKTEKDVVLCSLIMIVAFCFIQKIELDNDVLMIALYFMVGVVIYSLTMVLIKNPIVSECVRMVKR